MARPATAQRSDGDDVVTLHNRKTTGRKGERGGDYGLHHRGTLR
ncbi:hypothetical protein HMPREF1861_01182 [Corynebacterium kroppenstedtii]|nr:hypothetical protein HMPREF1861_01182 [Corynebacterium kroppenstedtii]